MSNEKFEDWLDDNFDQAFERAASRSSLPTNEESKRQSWQQVKLKMDQLNRRKQRRRRFRLTGIIAASVAIGAFLFSPPAITQAVTPFYHQIKDWGDGVVNMIFGRKDPVPENGAVTPPPPDVFQNPSRQSSEPYAEEAPVVFHELTEDEIMERLSFELPQFGYMPEGFSLDEMSALGGDHNEPVHEVTLRYLNREDQPLYVHLYNLDETASVALPAEVTEELTLDSGIEAAYNEDRYNSLKFIKNSVVYFIIGDVGKEDLLRIANTIH